MERYIVYMTSPKPKHYGHHKPDKNKKWINSKNNKHIFTSADEQINALLEPEKYPHETQKDPQIEAEMKENTPFPEETRIEYEATIKDNIDEDRIKKLLEDEQNSNHLDWDEEGEIYNFSLYEVANNINGNKTKAPEIKNSNIEENMLTVHGIIYENPENEKYLVHWDPAEYTTEGKKKKLSDKNNKPVIPTPNQKLENFEDYTNQPLNEGLENIYNSLKDLSKQYREKAEKSGPEDRIDSLWKSERWRGMADAIEIFKESHQKGYKQRKQIQELQRTQC